MLADALKIMLCDDRHHDMQKAAAFAKRLATFSLCVGPAESMAGMLSLSFRPLEIDVMYHLGLNCLCNFCAALVTVRHLLLKNVKCRNLLENDAGGGSVSGMIAVSF